MAADAKARPGVDGRMAPDERAQRQADWAAFINGELAARGLRPGQLAAYVHVDASTMSVWRQSRGLPSGDTVARVAQGLGLPFALVAACAGTASQAAALALRRVATDAEWRALLAELEALPTAQFREVKQALRLILSRWGQRGGGSALAV